VVIEQIDDVGPEALERSFGDLPDVLRPTVQDMLFAIVSKSKAELGGDPLLLTVSARLRFWLWS
jgi:hypothetical protein